MRISISREKIHNSFVEKVQELSGQNLLDCYQCGKCSAGCPSVAQMDLLPNQIIRFAQLGLEEELRKCQSIWVCASCLTCNVRCPKGINIAEVLEAIRQILLRHREDRVKIEDMTTEEKCSVPPIALVSNFRKSTS